jgi:hypothetical protein
VQRIDGHDAGARRETLLDAFDVNRLDERGANRFRDVQCVRGIGIVMMDEQRELVAADARDEIPARRRAAQPLCGRNEKIIARLVSVAVVHLFEVVEVDRDNPGRAIVDRRPGGNGFCGGLGEGAAVRQSGQGVVRGLVLKCRARPARTHLRPHDLHG